MAQRTALIVGAGIGGLAAGLALHQSGWRVRVFERVTNPGELGFALHLAPNGIAALRELGVGHRVLADGHIPTDVEVRRADGRVLAAFNVAAALGSTPSVLILRRVLYGALSSATKPESLILGHDATGFDITKSGVVLHFRNGRSDTGDILIGADGIGSAVRRRLHPHEPSPRRSPYLSLRGVAHDAERHLGKLSGVVYFSRGVEAAILKAGKQAVYWYLSLLAEDMPVEMRQAHAILEQYAVTLDESFRAVARATKPEDVRLDALCDRDPRGGWGRGPITLLGDAAHPMLPHTGQGAAQALEDAVALGLALARADDLDGALRRYEHLRAARTRRIVKQGRIVALFMTTDSRTIDWVRAKGLRWMPLGPMVRRYMRATVADPHRPLRNAMGA